MMILFCEAKVRLCYRSCQKDTGENGIPGGPQFAATFKTLTMKIIITVLSIISISFSSFAQRTDPVKKANESNEAKEDNKLVSEDVADFLVKSADARMMDAREGKLATQKATSQALRDYGKLMMKDQAMLLEKIKALAAKKHVTLPADVSNKKAEGREDLAEESGKDFDKKFVKMITIDHERDVKMFQKAIEQDDEDVRAFAQKYLPLIQSHLDKINTISSSL